MRSGQREGNTLGCAGSEATDKVTSCFQTGLCAESRPNSVAGDVFPVFADEVGEDPDPLEDVREPFAGPASWDLPEDADEAALPAPAVFTRLAASAALALLVSACALMLIAPRAESATEEVFRDMFVAVPLISFAVSSIGSRLTNSFCSNSTTTYGRACAVWTFTPRAEMSLTWIWPLGEREPAADAAAGLDMVPLEGDESEGGLDERAGAVAARVDEVVGMEGLSWLGRLDGGGLMLKSGACIESEVVGSAAAKVLTAGDCGCAPPRGVRSPFALCC